MTAPRGAATVGRIEDLDLPEQLAIHGFRQWCTAGPDGLSRHLDPAARDELALFCSLCLQAARRPLSPHGLQCRCLGADESALATLLNCARSGDSEDALMLAMLIVRADHAPALVSAARATALALCRQCLHDRRGATLH